MIKAIIVDDEAKSMATLNSLVTKYCPGVTIVETCNSVDTAIKSIHSNKPDLIFLDIEMPFGNGFTLFEKIKNPDFDVIFTTAYDHYAIKAIKFSALDYLLKPIDVDDLINAVSKIENKGSEKKTQLPDFELLLSNLKLKNKAAKIALPTFDGLQMVNAGDIVRCTADESYTQIMLSNGTKFVISRILKEYEELLSDFNFFRIHNSTLVNLTHVTKYIKGDGGYVVMSDGETVEVARRKKTELLNRLSLLEI